MGTIKKYFTDESLETLVASIQASDDTVLENAKIDSTTKDVVILSSAQDYTDEKTNNKPGLKTDGMTYTDADGSTKTCSNGEVFNAYSNDIKLGSNGVPSGGNLASGIFSTAMGCETAATNDSSVSTGYHTISSGVCSTSMGSNTVAIGRCQVVQGSWNIASDEYLHIIGNGTSSRSNAHTLDWDGNAWFSGNIKIGGTGQNDSNAKTIATEEYVNTKINELMATLSEIQSYLNI